jgi:hypothetical protein
VLDGVGVRVQSVLVGVSVYVTPFGRFRLAAPGVPPEAPCALISVVRHSNTAATNSTAVWWCISIARMQQKTIR